MKYTLTISVYPTADGCYRASIAGWTETEGDEGEFCGQCPNAALGCLMFYLSTLGGDPLANCSLDITLREKVTG